MPFLETFKNRELYLSQSCFIFAVSRVFDFSLSAEDMSKMSDLNVGWRHLLWTETALHFDYPFKDFLPFDYVPGKPDINVLSAPKPK